MTDYLARYIAGETVAVWDELTLLGDRVRAEPLLSQAKAVAQETMRRVRLNIETLVQRLQETGYEFGSLGGVETGSSWEYLNRLPVFGESDPGVLQRILTVERAFGPLPLSLCAWYETIGCVNLLGYHPAWATTGKDFLLDPLYGHPLDDEMVAWLPKDHASSTGAFQEDGSTWGITFSPDLYHKAGFSGGADYVIPPSANVDAPLLQERHGLHFIPYLRHCFAWAGMPGFADIPEVLRPRELLDFLRNGLLDI